MPPENDIDIEALEAVLTDEELQLFYEGSHTAYGREESDSPEIGE